MARRADRRRPVYRKKMQNRFSMFLVILVILVLLAAVSIRGYGLKQQLAEKQLQFAKNEEIIAQLEAESQKIEEYEKETKTLKYIEEMARKLFGLVYEDETVFMQEN